MKALIIHQTLFNALNKLSDADLGALIRAGAALVADGRDEAPAESGPLAFAWDVLRAQIIDNGVKYEEECLRRSDHARQAAWARHHPDGPPPPSRRPPARAFAGIP